MKANIKIAFILPSLANRGPVVFTNYLIQSLVHKVKLVDIYYFDEIKEIKFDCNCYRINRIKDINFNRYDIVQTTMFRPDVLVAFYKLIHRESIILISGIHNYIYEDMSYNYGKIKGFIISKIWTSFLKTFDGVIYSSNKMIDYYTGCIGYLPHKKISYGITEVEYTNRKLDFEFEIKKLKSNGYKLIGAVGLLIKRKGYHQIIQALTEIENHALIIIGAGSEELSLKQLVFENNLDDRVIFTGFQQNSREYYKYFDLYCMCSYSEGFGLAMLEALSAKIPLICSNLDIYKEYFSSENVGIFENDNLNSLIRQVHRVNNNYKHFSQAAYDIFNMFFSAEKMTDGHVEFYKEMIAKNK